MPPNHEPKTHPHFAVLAQCGRRVDGVDARVLERQVAGQVIADGAIGFGLSFQHFRHVGVPQVALSRNRNIPPAPRTSSRRPHGRRSTARSPSGTGRRSTDRYMRTSLPSVSFQITSGAHVLPEQVRIGILFWPCLPNIAEQRVRVAAQIVIEPLPNAHHIRACAPPTMVPNRIVIYRFPRRLRDRAPRTRPLASVCSMPLGEVAGAADSGSADDCTAAFTVVVPFSLTSATPKCTPFAPIAENVMTDLRSLSRGSSAKSPS